jgi:anaerobic selenocysteine-containing dehydrogenase
MNSIGKSREYHLICNFEWEAPVTLESLRWTAAILLLITGLIDIPYGWFFVAGYASYIWYAMGAVYTVTAGVFAMNLRHRIFQPWALAYTLFLLSAWVTGGYRDVVAYVDKAIEVALAINLLLLIRTTWPSTLIRSQ